MAGKEPSIKLNLGNALFNKDQRIEELSRENFRQEKELMVYQAAGERMKEEWRKLETDKKSAEARARILDLELVQAQMKLSSAELKNTKESKQVKVLSENTEGNMARIEALLRENDFLKNRCRELEGDGQRLAADLKLCSGRLDKAQKLLIEQQEFATKKQGEVGLLEKTLARKNDHITVLLKKDKELMTVQKSKRQEILEERLEEHIEMGPVESRLEKEWRDTAQSALTQVELLRKKLKRVEEEKGALEKENKKAKDDNFYLVNRLKSLKG